MHSRSHAQAMLRLRTLGISDTDDHAHVGDLCNTVFKPCPRHPRSLCTKGALALAEKCLLMQDSVDATATQLQELDMHTERVVAADALRDTLCAERMFAIQVRDTRKLTTPRGPVFQGRSSYQLDALLRLRQQHAPHWLQVALDPSHAG